MWDRVGRGAASVALVAAAVIAPAGTAGAAAAARQDPTEVCATARGHMQAGSLRRAEELYESVVTDGSQNCAIDGLKELAKRRREAAKAVTEGREFLRAGAFDKARDSFHHALCVDAENSAAAAGMAEVEKRKARAMAVESSRWERFYEDWVPAISQLLLAVLAALAVLIVLSGLMARLVVKVDAVAWPDGQRGVAKWCIAYPILLGVAVMFPAYAMFQPFHPFKRGEFLYKASVCAVVLIPLVILVLVLTASRQFREEEWRTSGRMRFLWENIWRDWRLLLGVLVVLALLTRFLGSRVFEDDVPHLGLTYGAITISGIMVAAAAWGQKPSLQVEAQRPDGTVDAAATDYLLARMQNLGEETPQQRLQAATPLSPLRLSQIASEDLSALPAGKFASALSRLFFDLRPDLTWRARVALVDYDRVAVALSRNGRHAASTIVSRLDFGLQAAPTILREREKSAQGSAREMTDNISELETTAARERARAQLLTGAAAFILLKMSDRHRKLKDGLCGASNWKSVMLQVIATSKSLIDGKGDEIPLLGRAMDEDPGYLLARFEYLSAVYRADKDADAGKYAELIDRLRRKIPQGEHGREREGWAPFSIRVLYSSATQWLNSYLEGGKQDSHALTAAESSVKELLSLCGSNYKDEKIRSQADRMLPLAENLKHCIEVLQGHYCPKWIHPHGDAPASPKLTYDHACLDCMLRDDDGAIEDLRFALVADDDKESARNDPCFWPLHDNENFWKVINGPSEEFLDLPTLARHKLQLMKANVITAHDLVRRTETDLQRSDLAKDLGVPRGLIERFRDLALLADLHPDLDDVRMLHLLVTVGVDSPAALRAALRDEQRLLRDVANQAKKRHLADLPGIRNPQPWLAAAKSAAAAAEPEARRRWWFGRRNR